MNKIIRDFINHLFDFGILGINSIKGFLQFYNQQKGYGNNVQETLAKILFEYFVNLDDKALEGICYDIIAKFAENKAFNNISSAKKILILKKKFESKFVNQNLKRWFKETFHAVGSGRQKSQEYRKSGANTNSRNLTSHEGNLHNLTSREVRDLKDLKDCTFKPKINSNFEFSSTERIGCNAFERLYQDHEKLKNKKLASKIELEEKETRKATFNPHLIAREKSVRSSSASKDRFLQRQDQILKEIKSKQNISKKGDDDEIAQCTFSPKIYSKIETDQPASLRLYNDNVRRIKNQKIMTQVREMELQKRSASNEKLRGDLTKFEEMYSEYKKRAQKLESLRKVHDKDRGITFQPTFYSNSNLIVSSSFSDRNTTEKKKTIPDYEKTSEVITPHSKKVPLRQYEEIEKGIVERLYRKEMEKLSERNRSKDRSETQSEANFKKTKKVDDSKTTSKKEGDSSGKLSSRMKF